MSFGGDDEQRVKRKNDAPREKPVPHRGRGVASSNGGAASSNGVARDRGSHDEQIWEEEALEMAGPIIPPNACP